MKKIYFLILLFIVANSISAQIINSYAGTGTAGFSGDNGAATAAQLNKPYGICADTIGNVFVADAFNLRIRKISTSGTITTLAGTGASRYAGDGGPATAASMTHPTDITTDRSGNVLFIDADSPRIRKISIAGIITTIAGTGIPGYSGDGGQATNAMFKGGFLLVDKVGNIIFSDGLNHRIRKINTSGIITTIAGTGSVGYSGDGGQATAASFQTVGGIAMDSSGTLYVADGSNFRIRKVDTSGIVTTIAGTGVNASSGDGGPASSANIGSSNGMVIVGNRLYFTEISYGRIRAINLSTGIVNTVIGDGTPCGFSGDGGPATAAKLCSPRGMAADRYGTIYFTEVTNHCIRYVRSTVDVHNENAPKSELLITPNPAISGVFTLKLVNEIDQSAHVVITNAIGVKVREQDCATNKETELQLNAPPGLYLVTVTTEHGSWSGRVAVER